MLSRNVCFIFFCRKEVQFLILPQFSQNLHCLKREINIEVFITRYFQLFLQDWYITFVILLLLNWSQTNLIHVPNLYTGLAYGIHYCCVSLKTTINVILFQVFYQTIFLIVCIFVNLQIIYKYTYWFLLSFKKIFN